VLLKITWTVVLLEDNFKTFNMKYNIIRSQIPDFLNSESKEYEDDKVFTNGYFYLYNKDVTYLEANLELFKRDSQESMTWILWCVVDAQKFIAFSENPNSYHGIINASLFSEIIFYEGTKGLNLVLDFKKKDDEYRPFIIIEENSKHAELVNDFSNGIEEVKFDSLMNIINP